MFLGMSVFGEMYQPKNNSWTNPSDFLKMLVRESWTPWAEMPLSMEEADLNSKIKS